jgi:hypothetical protein
MSDGAVWAALEKMEAWIADSEWSPKAADLEAWNSEFQAAMASAERSDGWEDFLNRAHTAGHALAVRAARLEQKKDAVKAELDAQALGRRALKGYRASTR